MKKALRGAQTLHAGCSKAEPKFFAHLRLPSRIIMVTDPHRPSATDRGDYNTLRHSLARSVKMFNLWLIS